MIKKIKREEGWDAHRNQSEVSVAPIQLSRQKSPFPWQ